MLLKIFFPTMYTQCSIVSEIILSVFSSSTAINKKLMKCLINIAKALTFDEVVDKFCENTAVHFMYVDWIRTFIQNHKTRRTEALKKNIHFFMFFSVFCISVSLWSSHVFVISNKNIIYYFAFTHRNFFFVYELFKAFINLIWKILFCNCCCVYITFLKKHQIT